MNENICQIDQNQRIVQNIKLVDKYILKYGVPVINRRMPGFCTTGQARRILQNIQSGYVSGWSISRQQQFDLLADLRSVLCAVMIQKIENYQPFKNLKQIIVDYQAIGWRDFESVDMWMPDQHLSTFLFACFSRATSYYISDYIFNSSDDTNVAIVDPVDPKPDHVDHDIILDIKTLISISTLTPRETDVIRNKYLSADYVLTVDEVSKILKISAETVKDYQQSAVKKMRQTVNRLGLVVDRVDHVDQNSENKYV
jgi:DNA-binding CsgD family transcriptional regulator